MKWDLCEGLLENGLLRCQNKRHTMVEDGDWWMVAGGGRRRKKEEDEKKE